MRVWIAAILVAWAGAAAAQSAEIANPNPATEQRLKTLAEELRCLVCQNQTIADSNAPLALDLRNQIRDQIGKGRTDSQIRDYMVARYGDFVLYKPPFKATTLVLWLAPPTLFLVGLLVWVRVSRRRPGAADSPAAAPAIEAGRRQELDALLQGDAPPNQPPAQQKKKRR